MSDVSQERGSDEPPPPVSPKSGEKAAPELAPAQPTLSHLYTSFDGRINRKPYWIGTIILVAVVLGISLIVGTLLGVSITAPDFRFKVVSLVMGFLVLYPAAALMVKRLYDRDRPAWLAGLFLAPGLIKSVTDVIGLTGNPLAPTMLDILLGVIVPIVGIWAFVELGCLRGSVGTNQHGPDPLSSSRAGLRGR